MGDVIQFNPKDRKVDHDVDFEGITLRDVLDIVLDDDDIKNCIIISKDTNDVVSLFSPGFLISSSIRFEFPVWSV